MRDRRLIVEPRPRLLTRRTALLGAGALTRLRVRQRISTRGLLSAMERVNATAQAALFDETRLAPELPRRATPQAPSLNASSRTRCRSRLQAGR